MSTVPPSPVPVTPPPRPRPHRTALYVGVGIAIVVAVALGVVLLVPPHPGTTAAVLTYSGAKSVADGTASGFQGGGWTLLIAIALVSNTTVPVPINTTAPSNFSCTYTLTVASLSSLTLPGYTGNRSLGLSPAWEFVYRNSADTLAVVSVIDGQGEALVTFTGLDCALAAQVLSPIPANAIDSSQAAAAVEPAARAFLAAHPNASAEYGLFGGAHYGDFPRTPEWLISYDTCAVSPYASGTGDRFEAAVNATSGQVVSTNTNSSVTCGGSPTEYEADASPAPASGVGAGSSTAVYAVPPRFETNGLP